MSITKKKKVVPTVEAKKPENVEKAPDMAKAESPSVDTGKSVETKQVSASPEPAFVGADAVLAKVDKGMLEKADLFGAGDLVRAAVGWMQGVDAKFNVVGGALQQLDKRFEGIPTEDSIANRFMEKLKAEREKAIAQQQSAPQNQQGQPQQQQSSGDSELKGLLKLLGVNEGGGSSESDNYFKTLGMETASMSHFMQKEMFKTMMPKAFEEWQKQQTANAAAKT